VFAEPRKRRVSANGCGRSTRPPQSAQLQSLTATPRRDRPKRNRHERPERTSALPEKALARRRLARTSAKATMRASGPDCRRPVPPCALLGRPATSRPSISTDRARRQSASRQSGTVAVPGARFSRFAIASTSDFKTALASVFTYAATAERSLGAAALLVATSRALAGTGARPAFVLARVSGEVSV
jgi:hypothetical protein